jgi:hypothetical protein
VLTFGGFWVSEFRSLQITVLRGMELRVANSVKMESLERDILEIKAEMARWQLKWEEKEQFIHGSGVEKHHVDNSK